MMKNRRMLCWLLLLALLCGECAVMSIGQTYAHYDSTVAASAMVMPGESGVISNCMVKAGEPSLTVLLGELDEPKEVSFWLKSCGADAEGELLWSVQAPETYLEFVQISMQINGGPVDPGDTVGLLQDATMSFDMTIAPSAIAQTQKHDEMKIHVVVTWGDEMWGTFQVILPAVAGDESTSETTGTDGTNEDPENLKNQNGETTGENTGENNGENTGENTGSNTGENGVDTSASTSDPADPTDETTQPSSEPTTETLPPLPPIFPYVPAEVTDETESEGSTADEVVSPDDPVQLKTLSRFDPAWQLPVKMTVSEDIASVSLGMEVKDGEETKFGSFPNYTMFSLDQGKSYYMLYDDASMKFDMEGAAELSVLMDFSRVDLQEDEALVLAMEAHSASAPTKIRRAEVMPDAHKSCLTLSHPLDAETGDVIFTAGDTRESAAAAEKFGWRSEILSYDNALEFVLPMEWLDAEVEYSVDMLTMTEEQTLEYVPVTLSETALYGKYQDFDLTHNLVLRVGETLPQAGTYRLNMKWSYEGICFSQTQTTFFINYLANTAQTPGG